jgi:hypothetical protein
MLGHERLELSDQLVMTPELEIGVDPELDGGGSDLLQPRDRGLRELLVREVREGRTAPLRQRLPQAFGRLSGQPAGQQAPPLVHQSLEAVEVERLRLDPQDVPGRPRREHVRRERPAQTRDVDAQRVAAPIARLVSPEVVDQAVGGDDLVGVQEQHRQKPARLGPAQWELTAVVPRLERSQDPELHAARLRAGRYQAAAPL